MNKNDNSVLKMPR